MGKDRDQLTPEEPEDRATLEANRGQGTGGTGYDRLPGEGPPTELGDAATGEDQDLP